MPRPKGAKNKKTIEREQANAATQDAPEETAEGFIVQDAPEDTWKDEPALSDGFSPKEALHSVLSRLGLASEDEPGKVSEAEKKQPRRAGLRKAQQEFCDTVTPIAVLAFVALMSWFWGRLGTAYRALAPDDETATKIVAPLIRVWARTTKISAKIDPNMTDILASLAAAVGYAFSCIETYTLIKKDLEAQNVQSTNARQTGDLSSYAGWNDIQTSNGGYDQQNASVQAINNGSLTEGERRHFERLSRLREQDIAYRARRDGIDLNI
jgi:hypothetical protein